MDFRPSQIIRQGDLLSPYIFVLCLERLSHLISKEFEQGSWRLFIIKRIGPIISHLYFADDMLLFAEANIDQMDRILGCLESFCKFSS